MRRQLEPEIAPEAFLDVLADHELAEILQIGHAIEEENALDELVGVLHLIDGFLLFVSSSRSSPQCPNMRA